MDNIEGAPTFALPPAEASAYGTWNPEATPGPGAASHPKRNLIVAGVAAAVIGLGGFLAVRAVAGHPTTAATATAPGGVGAGGPGGPGGAGFGGRGGFGGPGTAGTIAGINGSTLTLTTSSGSSLTVKTTSSTTVSSQSTGAVSDIKLGDNVIVVGTASGSTVAARGINDSGATAAGGAGAPPRAGGFVAGSVSAIDGGTLTVTESDGTKVSVTTSASTPVTILQTLPVSSLATGQTVRVTGATNSDGSVTATSIREGAGAGPGFGPGPGGPAN